MSRHLTYRSGNPVLNKSTFLSSHVQSEKMTINGTVNKTLISLILCVILISIQVLWKTNDKENNNNIIIHVEKKV